MLHGIGVDILSVSRLETLRGKFDDPFFTKTFTQAEYSEAMARPDPIVYFAGRFAAKEAVLKALGGVEGKFRFNEIETLNDGSGKPYVSLHGLAKETQDANGVKNLFVSLSNDGGYVVAYAICEK